MPENDQTDDNALKVLIHKRGLIKGKLTRFKGFIDSLSSTDTRLIENLTQLKIRLSKLEECWNDFETVQTDIELTDSSPSQLEEREHFENLYYDLSAKAQDIIVSHSIVTPNPSQPISFNTAQTNFEASPAPQIRLPTINLPTFHGNYEDWLSFSDSFQSLIHNNETLSDIQRLHYLKSALRGEASQVIQFLELTSSNYTVAWELLEKRYKNLRLIIQKHTKALFELPLVQRESTSSLRQLLDGFLSHVRALQALNQPTQHWDTLLIHLITSKLHPNTYKDWEMTTQPDIIPNLKDIIDFIEKRCHILENSSNIKTKPDQMQSPKQVKTSCFLSKETCLYCEGNHAIFQCESLIKALPADRYQRLKTVGLCFNCLKPGHVTQQCRSSGCKKCGSKHNTLLHYSTIKSKRDDVTKSNTELLKPKESVQTDKTDNPIHSCTSTNVTNSSHVLLSTALVDVVGANGITIKCRALLDSGSQTCLMSETIAQHLRLPKITKPSLKIKGIDQSVIQVNGATQALIKSCVSNFRATLQFLIVSKITGDLPSTSINISMMKFPNNIILADPSFHCKGKIDLLLGQEVFLDLLCIGQIKTPGYPTLQKTKLGWIVGGKLELTEAHNSSVNCNLTTTERIDRQLQNFWLLEEAGTQHVHLTAEQKACEEHFSKYTKRTSEGRYIVTMPLKSESSELGNSKELAVKRFLQVEKRLQHDKNLKSEYTRFMSEYESLGHMEKQNNFNDVDKQEYFLPHHPVINTLSTTTKVRVVFDGSAKSTSGKSLNDLQLVGPTIQRDIVSVLISFRMHNYVMTADLEKMFRQILIEESQRNLQKIIWRANPTEPLQIYKLKTVTYGTSSASYLATRTLKQLAEDEQQNFPKAANVLQKDFYVDDLITGCSSENEAKDLQKQLIELLKKGGFNLRKWNSNSKKLLAHLPDELLNLKPQQFQDNEEVSVKTLGLWWDSNEDMLKFKYSPLKEKTSTEVTKRTILSNISKLFDPLGLLSPILIKAKILMQELWKLKLTWDESIPVDLHTSWNQFLVCLHNLNDMRIPRQATLTSSNGTYEIHCFADSSERAYGGVIYLRHEDNEGNIKVSLICSKSRVAPLQTTSLPRLELCAALLVAKLTNQIEKALQVETTSVTYWTDSSITLAWIRGEPARWTTFVANRVAKIQNLTKEREWRHVASENNPADLISRGSKTKNLIDSKLWWHGPYWLEKAKCHWPNSEHVQMVDGKELPEQKIIKSNFLITNQEENIISILLEKHSSFEKIKRILSWSLRFVKGPKLEGQSKPNTLQLEELQYAERLIIKNVQMQVFSQEIKDLTSGVIKPSSKFLSLDPFTDEYGILRVGGRIDKSALSYDSKHQILLPRNHRLTKMIAREEHIRQLHCGPQTLLYALRQKYWIVSGREVVKKVTHQCLKCFRAKPKIQEQKMSELPADRVNLTRPFLHSGVDYCGPFLIKPSKHKRASAVKSYVAVFVCLATKCMHLELVSDLTTAAFLAAIRRFVSRRGICESIRSDNSKTFIGANRKLAELKSFLDTGNDNITEAAMKEGIKWSFNPPHSPHMGGIWEAAVKSCKYHLVRVIGNASLTFEEFNTILTQIEAVLNSRPLTPMSNSPSDLSVLTPSHFLIGSVLTAIPEKSLTKFPENRLTRWQRLQQLHQHFWNRWSREYLNNLQQRHKWKASSPSLKVGDLVLLKEDNLPPLSWPLGRVTAIHPGRDNLVRTVTVKTSKNSLLRNVHKLCLLPIEK